jgi:hypothetical protein
LGKEGMAREGGGEAAQISTSSPTPSILAKNERCMEGGIGSKSKEKGNNKWGICPQELRGNEWSNSFVCDIDPLQMTVDQNCFQFGKSRIDRGLNPSRSHLLRFLWRMTKIILGMTVLGGITNEIFKSRIYIDE